MIKVNLIILCHIAFGVGFVVPGTSLPYIDSDGSRSVFLYVPAC